ncbi:MAG TPA: DUF1330 domain-containing protein, partial [Chthoniobacterales bacterium]
MMVRYYLLLAGTAGIAAGGIGSTAIHAQTPSKPIAPAYYIAEFELTDPEGIRPYSAGVAETFEPFGGRFIIRGGEIAPLEGKPPEGRLVVIAFDSMEKAQAWYSSAEYQKLKPIRQSRATRELSSLKAYLNRRRACTTVAIA